MSERLQFDEVKPGDVAPPLSHTLTRTDLVMYTGASGDFNPMHTDEVAATGVGLPSVFGHGMFSMGLLGTALTNYVGVANLKSFKVRFTKQTWPAERLTTAIVVSRDPRDRRREVGRTRLLARQRRRRGQGRRRGRRLRRLRTHGERWRGSGRSANALHHRCCPADVAPLGAGRARAAGDAGGDVARRPRTTRRPEPEVPRCSRPWVRSAS